MQRYRLLARVAFFALFVLAPPLDLFRFDLTVNHLFFLGEPWRLGFTVQSDGIDMVGSIFLRIFLPIFLVVGVGGWISLLPKVLSGWQTAKPWWSVSIAPVPSCAAIAMRLVNMPAPCA